MGHSKTIYVEIQHFDLKVIFHLLDTYKARLFFKNDKSDVPCSPSNEKGKYQMPES